MPQVRVVGRARQLFEGLVGVAVDLRPLVKDALGTTLPSCPLETESYRVVNKKVEDRMEGKGRKAPVAPRRPGERRPRAGLPGAG